MSITQYIDLLLRKSLLPLNNLRTKRNPAEATLIAELRHRIKKLKIPKKNKLIHNKWLVGIIMLRKQILTQNPRNFLQWEVIRATMFIGNALFTIKEFIFLRRHNWNKWRKAISEKNYISTEPYLLYPKSSGNLIHQAYHLAKFEQICGETINDYDFIFEYGGGYGSMCQLVHNLGFKGRYVIFDFSVFSALQIFFLKINGFNPSSDILDKKAEILCLDNIKDVKKIIPRKGKKLFIATWSLSESPLTIRKKVYPLIKDMDTHIIGYQYNFGEIDNYQYFKNYQLKLNKLKWWNQEIKQLSNNYYLFGFK